MSKEEKIEGARRMGGSIVTLVGRKGKKATLYFSSTLSIEMKRRKFSQAQVSFGEFENRLQILFTSDSEKRKGWAKIIYCQEGGAELWLGEKLFPYTSLPLGRRKGTASWLSSNRMIIVFPFLFDDSPFPKPALFLPSRLEPFDHCSLMMRCISNWASMSIYFHRKATQQLRKEGIKGFTPYFKKNLMFIFKDSDSIFTKKRKACLKKFLQGSDPCKLL